MPVNRIPYRLGDFSGEHNSSSLVNQRIYGSREKRGRAKLSKLRHYHVFGQGRARKRNGYQAYISGAINGADVPGQGAFLYRKGTTYRFISVAGDAVKVMDHDNDKWDAITGSVVSTAGRDILSRWGMFNDGTDIWAMHSNGADEPWLWDGNPSNNCRLISTFDSTAPKTEVVGMIHFKGHVWMLTYNDLHWSAYGSVSGLDGTAGGGILAAGRGGRGLALHRHSSKVALIFYEGDEGGIYKLESEPFEGSLWRVKELEGVEGCISKTSIITKDGKTYYAGSRGIHRISSSGSSEFIGLEIEDYFLSLNQSRNFYITAVPRPQPWSELLWLVSQGTTQASHNALLCFNTKLDAWSIWPPSQTTGKLAFNCGHTWIDGNYIPRTIMIGEDGVAYEAFGHSAAESGTTDDGTSINSEITTGFLDFGWPGVSYLRNLILDIETPTAKTFTLTATPMGKSPLVKTFTVGAGGDLLDVGFILDESVLGTSLETQAQVRVNQDGRYIQVKLTESDTDTPHVLGAINMPHKNGGMRMVA